MITTPGSKIIAISTNPFILQQHAHLCDILNRENHTCDVETVGHSLVLTRLQGFYQPQNNSSRTRKETEKNLLILLDTFARALYVEYNLYKNTQ